MYAKGRTNISFKSSGNAVNDPQQNRALLNCHYALIKHILEVFIKKGLKYDFHRKNSRRSQNA